MTIETLRRLQSRQLLRARCVACGGNLCLDVLESDDCRAVYTCLHCARSIEVEITQ